MYEVKYEGESRNTHEEVYEEEYWEYDGEVEDEFEKIKEVYVSR